MNPKKINLPLLKQRISLAEYIGLYTKTEKKSNGQYIALCPFPSHPEKTPSFSINELKGCYHCFGCGKSGDIISFVMEYKGIGYVEALESLARSVGMELREEVKEHSHYEIHRTVAKIYTEELGYSESAIAYAKQRNLTPALVERFAIGYSPLGHRSKIVLDRIRAAFDERSLLEAHVVCKGKDGRLFDPFMGRLIFPIYDRSGRACGFGGRIIEKSSTKPKYLNSAQSEFFQKKELLYGYSLLNGKGPLLLVEGYMDVISLSRIGINAVAPLGTSVRAEHIELLWSNSHLPILSLDNDAAGRQATLNLIQSLLPNLTPQKQIKVLTLTDFKDPDELVSKFSPEQIQEVINRSQNLSEFLFEVEAKQAVRSSEDIIPEAIAQLKDRLFNLTNQMLHRDLASEYRHYFSTRCRELRQHPKKFKNELIRITGSPSHLSQDEATFATLVRVLTNSKETFWDNEVYGNLILLDPPNQALQFILNCLIEFMEARTDQTFISFVNHKVLLKSWQETGIDLNPTELNSIPILMQAITTSHEQMSLAVSKQIAIRAIRVIQLSSIQNEISKLQSQMASVLKTQVDQSDLLVLERQFMNLKKQQTDLCNSLRSASNSNG